MGKSFLVVLAALVILPLAVFGCKGKVEKPQESMPPVMMENQTQDMTNTSSLENIAVTEPAQTIPAETIPPTAAPEAKPAVTAAPSADARNRDIQRALKNAGFYAGAIDGKMGPKTKSAIISFQKAKGLKADGKVGPKTWAELEKYLVQQ